MTRQISISNDVMNFFQKEKAKRSSQFIKENLCPEETKVDVMSFAGALKDDKQTLERLKSKIASERDANYGRTLT